MTNIMDDWPKLTAPQELAQMMAYGTEHEIRGTLDNVPGPYFQDWHNKAQLNTEPLQPMHHRWMHALGNLVTRGLVALGKPYIVRNDGVIFTPWGAVMDDTTSDVNPNRPVASHWDADWQALGERIWRECGRQPHTHRVPAPPAPGWEWVAGTDHLTGWPYFQLKRVLPEGCADCESEWIRALPPPTGPIPEGWEPVPHFDKFGRVDFTLRQVTP